MPLGLHSLLFVLGAAEVVHTKVKAATAGISRNMTPPL